MLRSKGGGYSCGSNGCLVFYGALPVVLVFVFSPCYIEAGAPGRQERICPDVVRAGVTGVVAVCFLVVFGALFFGVIFFFIFILQHRRWQRGVGFSFVRTRVLQAGCSFTTFSGA